MECFRLQCNENSARELSILFPGRTGTTSLQPDMIALDMANRWYTDGFAEAVGALGPSPVYIAIHLALP